MLPIFGIKPVGAVSSWSGEPWYDHHIADRMEGVEVVGQETAIDLEAITKLEPSRFTKPSSAIMSVTFVSLVACWIN